MNVGVCYAEADRQLWLRLEVPDGSTVQQAIELSGVLKRYPNIDLETQKVGIFGKFAKLDTPVKEGDRVEYGTVLSPEAVTLFFVENINKPMLINLAGVDFRFIPYKDGMVWNETLDVLYIEKSDLKGQSAEDKVVTAYEAAKSYKFKADTLTYDEALANTFVVKKDLASGPV